LCPAKFAAFSWFSQSHTVVMALAPMRALRTQVPLAQVLLAVVPPSDSAAQVAASAAVGWQ